MLEILETGREKVEAVADYFRKQGIDLERVTNENASIVWYQTQDRILQLYADTRECKFCVKALTNFFQHTLPYLCALTFGFSGFDTVEKIASIDPEEMGFALLTIYDLVKKQKEGNSYVPFKSVDAANPKKFSFVL